VITLPFNSQGEKILKYPEKWGMKKAETGLGRALTMRMFRDKKIQMKRELQKEPLLGSNPVT